MSVRPLRSSTLLGLVLALALGLLLRMPSVAMPLERDEGEYAYVAQRWLVGEPPYASAFFQKPPGIVAAYAVAFALGGETPAAARWAVTVFVEATLILMFFVSRRLVSEAAALAATAFFALLCSHPAFLGNAANTELFMLAPLTASLLAALRAAEDRSIAESSVAGALAGAALLFKQPAAPNVLLALALVAAGGGRVGAGRRAVAFFLGAVAAVAPVLAYFAAVGALRELWDCVFGYNLAYASALDLGGYVEAIRRSFPASLRPFAVLYALAAIGAAAASLRAVLGDADPVERRGARWLLGWLTASLVGVAAGGYFREHYYLQAAPPVAALAGLGAAEVLAPALVRRRRSLALAALVAVVVLVGVASSPGYYFLTSPALRSRLLYGENPFAESPAVAQFVAACTSPQDTVFIFGSESQVLFLANRRGASRYIFVYPLMLPTGEAQLRQRRTLEEIRKAPPSVIVTVTAPTSFLRSPRTPPDLFFGLREMLRSDYRLVARVPAEARDRLDRVTAEDADRAWAGDPGLGHPEVWGTLAVWGRIAGGAPARCGVPP